MVLYMTLSTNFRILSPITDPEYLFHFAQELLGRPASGQEWHKEVERGELVYSTVPGQGLDAWLIMHVGMDGPIQDDPCSAVEDGEDCSEDDPCYACRKPVASVEFDFDTGYAYQGPEGGCADLHARYIVALRDLCVSKGWEWAWMDEFRGEWHVNTFEGMDDFLGYNSHNRNGDRFWYEAEVLPRIAGAA